MPVLSPTQIAAVARQAGWPAGDAIIAVAITNPESSRNSSAIQQGVPYSAQGWGLWQITPGDSEPQFGIDNQLLDPLNNARAAWAKFQTQGGFRPWTTYTSGKYLPFVPAAEAGVAAAYKLTAKQLAAAVAAARTAAGGATAGTPSASDWSVWVGQAASLTAASALKTEAHAQALKELSGRFRAPRPTVGNPNRILVNPERLRNG
jgi:Lysozyme like domain